MQSIVRRIFGDRKLPESMSDQEYDAFMNENFPKWVTEFENNGFLAATKLPPIVSEEDLVQKLIEHKDELVVIKYWKHGCMPCLSFAEMYKAAEQKCIAEKRPIRWYSVDTKCSSAKELVDFQLVDGTPTVQTFRNGKQVGSEIRVTQLEDLMQVLASR